MYINKIKLERQIFHFTLVAKFMIKFLWTLVLDFRDFKYLTSQSTQFLRSLCIINF